MSAGSPDEASPPTVLSVAGPTASGKSDLALALARAFGGEIVSVDSAQIYRGLDIGSAKPDAAVRSEIRHHLIDILDPDQSYSAARFAADVEVAIRDIASRGRLPVLAGGTMLYYRALREGLSDLPKADPRLREELTRRGLEAGWPALHAELARLDPATAARLKSTDAQRIQRALEVCLLTGRPMSSQLGRRESAFAYRSIDVAIVPSDRAALHDGIARRFDAMLDAGLVEELRELRTRHRLDPSMPSMRCVGYRAAWGYLDGGYGRGELRERGIAATRQLAKRQLTWLRSEPHWNVFDSLDTALHAAVLDYVGRRLES